MYLLYLRCKAFLIRHKLIVRIIFGVNIAFLISLFSIGIKSLIQDSSRGWIFGWPFLTSTCILVPLCVIFEHLKLNDIQKKVLCMHFRTGYKKCDDLIEMIIKAARKKELILKFTYKELETSAVYLNTVIDEPIVDPATINGIYLTPLIKYPMPQADGDNWLYLREFLVSYTNNSTDYMELEKTFIKHLT